MPKIKGTLFFITLWLTAMAVVILNIIVFVDNMRTGEVVEIIRSEPIYIATTTEREVIKVSTSTEYITEYYPEYITIDCPVLECPICDNEELNQAFEDFKYNCDMEIDKWRGDFERCFNNPK